MSIKVMSVVFELELNHTDMFILLAMADHADDQGQRCYPSVARLAHKTSYSERQVRRSLRALEKSQIIVPVAYANGGRGLATEYHIHTEKGVKKSPFSSEKTRTFTTQKADILSQKADIYDTKGGQGGPPTVINHQETVIEPSGEPPAWFAILSDIPKFKPTLSHANEWLAKQAISLQLAETTAYAVKAFMAKPKERGRDPWATFQNWVRRDRDKTKPNNHRVNDIDWVAEAALINQRSGNDATISG
jgi:hypothetical protein